MVERLRQKIAQTHEAQARSALGYAAMGTTRRSVAVFGAFAAMFATSPGQTFVISNYNEPVGESLGMEASTLAGAYLVGTLLSAASLTHAGRVADRIGPRHMVGLSSIGLAVAGFAFSRAHDLSLIHI